MSEIDRLHLVTCDHSVQFTNPHARALFKLAGAVELGQARIVSETLGEQRNNEEEFDAHPFAKLRASNAIVDVRTIEIEIVPGALR